MKLAVLLSFGLLLAGVSAAIDVQFSVHPDSCGRCEFKMKLFNANIAATDKLTNQFDFVQIKCDQVSAPGAQVLQRSRGFWAVVQDGQLNANKELEFAFMGTYVNTLGTGKFLVPNWDAKSIFDKAPTVLINKNTVEFTAKA